jgi:methyl coenzyme M reductase subunit D
VRSIPQVVSHTPIQDCPELPDNRAHTDVIGEKTVEVRVKLGRIVTWAIRQGSTVED